MCAGVWFGLLIGGFPFKRRFWFLFSRVAVCACQLCLGGTERPEADAGSLRQLRGAVCTQDLLQVGLACLLAWLGLYRVLSCPVSNCSLCFIVSRLVL